MRSLRNRKLRLALVFGFAVAVLFIAWRLDPSMRHAACTPERTVEKDAQGRVTQIVRKDCPGQ